VAAHNLPKPLILGHRGASAYAPENTLAAFRLALEQGADGFELDVTLSSDQVVVVIHDDTVDRTTDGHGRVDALTLSQLQQLDASAPGKFGAQFKGARLPTLDEVFRAVGAAPAEEAAPPFINVELKRDTSPGCQLAAQVVALIRAHGLERQVLLSSFYTDNLQRAKRLAPEVPAGLLFAPDEPLRMLGTLCFPGLRAEAEHPPAALVNALTLRWWHRRGRRVNTWTVNTEAALRRVMRLGVDGVITNVPDLAVRVRRDLAPIFPAAS